ncbi:MAG TPA: carbon-nitrogen hydrolase family protein [Clostridia bacterium]
METFKSAICQIKPTYNKKHNIEKALSMMEKAADEGSNLIILPEMFFYPYEMNLLKDEADDDKSTIRDLCAFAKKRGIWVCSGSIAEKDGNHIYNTSYLISNTGETVLKYSKSHLFDVNLPGLVVSESSLFKKGDGIAVANTTFGTVAICICYDIRFPEYIRKAALLGADILIVPAAFNTVTGPAHWHITFRARAVDNQLYVLAASPAKNAESKYHAYGHSMFINPWGEVLSEASDEETIIYAEIDMKKVKEVRERLPLLMHRRVELY